MKISARHLAGAGVRCAALLVLVLLIPACGKKTPAPAANRVDLSKATGVFRATPGAQANLQAVAVSVNGKPITHGDILVELQKNPGRAGNPVTAQQAANNLIARALLLQAAEKENIVISGQELATNIDLIRKQLPTNTTLEAAIRNNHLTEQEFRANILSELKISRLVERHLKKGQVVTDAELAQYVQEHPDVLHVPENVTVRHILITVRPDDTPAVKKSKQERAAWIRQQLLAGSKFETLATTMSDDPSKVRGGLLPAIARGQVIDPAFDTAAFTQKTNEIGPVIKTQWGYDIIQVQDHRPAHVLKLADIQDRLRQFVLQQKRQQALQTYLNELRAKASIVFAPAR